MKQNDSNSGGREVVSPRILLTATNRWPSPARLAIGLTKTGCHVSAVCPTQGYPITSTTVVKEVFPYSSIRPLESLIIAIQRNNPQIIIPCDDQGVQHLHELHARAISEGANGKAIASLIEYSLGCPENFALVAGRCGLLEIAKNEGLRVPETMLLKSANDLI